MKPFSPARILASLSFFVAALTTAAHGQYTNGQSASSVLGQPTFTSGVANYPSGTVNQSSLRSPQGAVVDPATGKLFVVDTGNNRVLRFSSAASFASGSAAEAVFGQTSFLTAAAPVTPTATSLNAPAGATIDKAGNLWVADTNYNRVVCYNSAATVGNGATAAIVLGQATISGNVAATTQTGMRNPSGVSVDSNGSLFVADRDNNRVLRFDNAAAKTTGSPANGILGQDNFLSQTFATTANTLHLPYNLSVDADNNLWVADLANNRVLCFSNAASAANGASASAVLGQTSFTTSASAVTNSSLSAPIAVTFDTVGRLYVSDFGNNRVLIFENVDTIANGGAASLVLGQTSFTTNTAGVTAGGLNNPWGLTYSSSGNLFVADSNSSANRVLRYTITAGSPVISSSPNSPKITAGKTKSYQVYLTNLGASDVFGLQYTISSTSKKKAKSLTFSYAGEDITSDLAAGTFVSPELATGQALQITVKITARNNATGPLSISYAATSKTFSTVTASKTVKTTVKQP